MFDPDQVNFSFHLSIQPLVLDITAATDGSLTRSDAPPRHSPAKRANEAYLKRSLGSYYPARREEVLVQVINQVNATQTVQGLIRHYVLETPTPWASLSWLNWVWDPLLYPPLSAGHGDEGNSAQSPSVLPLTEQPLPPWLRFTRAVYALGTQLLLCLLIGLRLLTELLLRILNFRYRRFMLKQSMAIGQQLDLRLQQITNMPFHYIMLRRKYWNDPCRRTALYINFYNHLWLIVGDVCIGLFIHHALLTYGPSVAQMLHDRVNYYSVTALESTIAWLMGWPAGMKLNPQLDEFLGELFLWLIRVWTVMIHPSRATTTLLVRIIGRCGFLGASFQVALLSDYISIMTLHIYWFYAVAARIYFWQLSILHSLLNLFRGRRINPLRCRVDPCNFELDQLLLGTIILALVFFLFPTIAVYYLTFAGSRVGIIVVQGTLEMILAALNHFPFFALVLRLALPRRFPGGVRMSLMTTPSSFWKPRHKWLKQLDRLARWGRSIFYSAGSSEPGTRTVVSRHCLSRYFAPGSPFPDGSRGTGDSPRLPGFFGRWPTTVVSPGHSQPPPTRPTRVCSPLVPDGSSKHPAAHHHLSTAPELTSAVPSTDSHYLPPSRQPAVEVYQCSPPVSTVYLGIETNPLPISGVFFQYFQLWKQLSKQYFSASIMKAFFTGELIRPVPRLQYSMFPDTIPSLESMWKLMINSGDRSP